MNKWSKESARPNIAYRWLAARLVEELNVRLKQGKENPTNYAHRVWYYNRALLAKDEVKPFQVAVVFFIKDLKAGLEYQALITGTASDELINATLLAYNASRKCRQYRRRKA